MTWQIGMASSTSLSAGVDEFYPKTRTGQSAQYLLHHTLQKDSRLRARQFSSGASGSVVIRVEALLVEMEPQ